MVESDARGDAGLVDGSFSDDFDGKTAKSSLSPEATINKPSLSSVFQGHFLHQYQWKPAGDIKAIVYICHGIHEHIGRYNELAEHLSESGILVNGLDLVGHGKSDGERGLIDSIESYVTDVIKHIEMTRTEYETVPLFLFGHSNGGVVAIGTLLRIQHMFTGAIISSPGIIVEGSVLIKFAAKIIGYTFPSTGLKSFDTSTISSLPEEVERYANDPLIYHGKVKAGWVSALLAATEIYQTRLHEISLPLLLVHGTEDQLVPLAASEMIYNNTSSANKSFERFDGSRHEILHDKDQEKARHLITKWILDNVQHVHVENPVKIQGED